MEEDGDQLDRSMKNGVLTQSQGGEESPICDKTKKG
jgi:hypothetical protein